MIYARPLPYERGPLFSLALKAILSLVMMDQLAGCMADQEKAQAGEQTQAPALQSEPGAALGKFRNTYYYVVLETDYVRDPADTEVLDIHGERIATVPAAFKKATDIEGSAKLRDGRVINFAAYRRGQYLYKVVNDEWGVGMRNCELRPFHTIAVDPHRIPPGSIVEIEETRGMVLPDGTIHDGLWRAEDVGSAIQNDRIDLFIGEARNGRFLSQAGIRNLQPLTVKMVQALPPDSCLR